MTRIIEFRSATGEPIYIESADNSVDDHLSSRDHHVIAAASEMFEQALDRVKHASAVIMSRLGKLPIQPETMEVEFGLKASAKAGIYIASADSEAQFRVKLIWKPGVAK